MSFTLNLGATAPDFQLQGVDGNTYSLEDFSKAELLVVVFTCNHCHYAYGADDRLIRMFEEYHPRGVSFVAINSNDTANHPDDSFEHMLQCAAEKNFPYPYLRDETQETAKEYGALKTPHFYVFDGRRNLCYTGRMDDNPRDEHLASTSELADALEDLLAGREVQTPLTNPIGCNIKWRGREEHWMPPEACDLV